MKSLSLSSIAFLACLELSVGAHLRHSTPNRQLGNDFLALTQLVQSYYESTCTQEVLQSGPNDAMTQFACQQPGGTATLEASGTPPDAIPKSLQVCEYGSNMKETCHRIPLNGQHSANDMERAKEFLDGHTPKTFTAFDALVELLNQEYSDSCSDYVSNSVPSSVQVQCTKPGGSAILYATGTGSTDPSTVPSELEVCMIGGEMKRTCDAVALTGAKLRDLKLATALLNSSLSTDSEYEMLVQLVNSTYDGSCQQDITVLPPGPTSFVVQCTIPGGTATLTAQQTTGESVPMPQSLQVCQTGTESDPNCEKVNFSGREKADFNKARLILG